MTQIHNSKVEFDEQFAVWTTLALMDGLFSVAGDIGTIVANPYGSVPTAGRHRPSCFWAHFTDSFTTRPTVVNLGRSLGLFKGHDSSGKLRNWPVLFWNGQEFKKGSLNIHWGIIPGEKMIMDIVLIRAHISFSLTFWRFEIGLAYTAMFDVFVWDPVRRTGGVL